ncbi:MAG: transcription elongation factor GreA [Chitinispirillaceae bacterium]|nr:transcription elongation factor GreA [Chitinispirillaceae bacterium]
MEKTYVTTEGLMKLESDLEYLKTTRRREIAKQLNLARSFGDLRENAEYEAAKQSLSLNEIRIRELEEKVAGAEVINYNPEQNGRIFIGTRVTLRDLDFEEDVVYKLTGSEESNPGEGMISVNSPVAKALLGHSIGDCVEINVPRGMLKYKVVAIGR